jgi:formyltetrahydrofolate deformylase
MDTCRATRQKQAPRKPDTRMPKPIYLITFSCPNQPGIVAAVTTELFAQGGNILEAHQFDDGETTRFFMRMLFDFSGIDRFEALTKSFEPIASRYKMNWRMRPVEQRSKVLLLVSNVDHCLVDLLYRHRIGELPMDIVGIVSNHPQSMHAANDFGVIPFHHFPITKETKPAQEALIKGVIEQTGAELIVLARYMQILSEDMARYLSGRCINIHHSFLPGFKGAKPYHQAHARGVKLIGATAHYVTSDLDEGPIIEQDVERVSHHDKPEDLVRKGRDIERRVLARAVSLHIAGRAFLNDAKTVVFRD